MRPYIGITGIATQKEAASFARLTPPASHALMAGYAMTPSSLRDMPLGNRYAALSALPDLLSATKSHVNVVHYSTRGSIVQELRQLLSFQGIYDRALCRAVQCNTSIRREEVNRLKNVFPDLYIILPLEIPSESHWQQTLETIALLPVDAFLIDSSRGKGIRFNIPPAARFYKDLRAVTGLPGGFAGGFTPENVLGRVRDLRSLVGDDFSIDAETGMRTGDALDTQKMNVYSIEAKCGFSSAVPGNAAGLRSAAVR